MKILIYILILVSPLKCASQSAYDIKNDEDLSIALTKLISKQLKIDPSQELKLVLELKVDSLGEIHSCHIRWSVNLDCSDYYSITKELELKYNAKYLFDKFKDKKLTDNYAYCQFPFTLN